MDRARAGRTGAPRNGRQAGGQGGAPGGAAPYVTGRARLHVCRARRVGNPASKGASQALWRLPPLHRPRALSARDWQTSEALRRENVEAWLFDIVDRKLSK